MSYAYSVESLKWLALTTNHHRTCPMAVYRCVSWVKYAEVQQHRGSRDSRRDQRPSGIPNGNVKWECVRRQIQSRVTFPFNVSV